MNFKELDSLDKFLLIYEKLQISSIKTCKDFHLKEIYLKEISLTRAIVDFVKCVEKLSDDELEEQLWAFGEDIDLAKFLSQITATNINKWEELDNGKK